MTHVMRHVLWDLYYIAPANKSINHPCTYNTKLKFVVHRTKLTRTISYGTTNQLTTPRGPHSAPYEHYVTLQKSSQKTGDFNYSKHTVIHHDLKIEKWRIKSFFF
eukprot:73240_1